MTRAERKAAAKLLGAAGGKARVANMTPEELSAANSKAGLARATALTPERRREIAMMGVAARAKKRAKTRR